MENKGKLFSVSIVSFVDEEKIPEDYNASSLCCSFSFTSLERKSESNDWKAQQLNEKRIKLMDFMM